MRLPDYFSMGLAVRAVEAWLAGDTRTFMRIVRENPDTLGNSLVGLCCSLALALAKELRTPVGQLLRALEAEAARKAVEEERSS